jgi:hypothetical protein
MSWPQQHLVEGGRGGGVEWLDSCENVVEEREVGHAGGKRRSRLAVLGSWRLMSLLSAEGQRASVKVSKNTQSQCGCVGSLWRRAIGCGVVAAAVVVTNITIIACMSVTLHCCKHARVRRPVRLSSDSGGPTGFGFWRLGGERKGQGRGIRVGSGADVLDHSADKGRR